MRALAILAAASILGCAGTPVETVSRDSDTKLITTPVRSAAAGPNRWTVSCSQPAASCAREATKLCGGAYTTLSSVTTPSENNRITMLVRCDP